MANKCYSMLKGWALRATKLDGCGRVVTDRCASITTDGFISVALTANLNEGEEITQLNARGETCVQEPAVAEMKNYGASITFCEVDPELYAMLTGNPVEYDANGDAVGFRVESGRSLDLQGVALELWSKVPGVACSDEENSQGSFGYMLLPYMSGGVLGDFTLENGTVTFQVTSMTSRSGAGWGVGPYDVVSDGSGGNGPLVEPIGPKQHLLVRWTTVAPPEPGCECVASGPPATGATAGTPGTWTPADSYAPENLADLQASSITADPATAWATGEHVVLGDDSHAFWDGTDWVAGDAP